MSRGPGRWQRAILTALQSSNGGPVVLTQPTDTHAVQNAVRRAAIALEAGGKIVLRSQQILGRQSRLVAYSPGAPDLPEAHAVMGLDGKTYRRPALK